MSSPLAAHLDRSTTGAGTGEAEVFPKARRRGRHRLRSPLLLLALVAVASTASRSVWISAPPTVAGDERYYVSAARSMVELPPAEDEYYSGTPRGEDPNSEHPPLAKLMVGLSMRALGDRPLAWRLPTVAFGTLAVLIMYWVVRSAGGRPREALLAATLMAAENLFMVFGRLATLDVIPVTFMLLGLGLYLRRRPVLAGIALGLGGTGKLVALSAAAVIVVLEMLRWAQQRRSDNDATFDPPPVKPSPRRLGTCLLAAAAVYLAVLGALDYRFSSMPDPVAHTRSMVDYAEVTTFQAEAQIRGTFNQGALAPTSKPWQWLINDGTYSASRRPAAPSGQPGAERDLLDLRISLSPFVVWLLAPAMLVAAYRCWARSDGPSTVAVAWAGTTFGLLVIVALRERVGYLYYMVSVLPGVHMALAGLFARGRVRWPALGALAVLVAGSVVALYPFRTWGGT